MTNIIVTVPKSEYRHVLIDKFGEEVGDATEEDIANPDMESWLVEVPRIETQGDMTPFWNLGRRPKHLTDRDKIYFILNDEVYAYAYVEDIDEGTEACGITGRQWKGCQVYFCDVHVIPKEKRKQMKGFRGFRYVTKEMNL